MLLFDVLELSWFRVIMSVVIVRLMVVMLSFSVIRWIMLEWSLLGVCGDDVVLEVMLWLFLDYCLVIVLVVCFCVFYLFCGIGGFVNCWSECVHLLSLRVWLWWLTVMFVVFCFICLVDL